MLSRACSLPYSFNYSNTRLLPPYLTHSFTHSLARILASPTLFHSVACFLFLILVSLTHSLTFSHLLMFSLTHFLACCRNSSLIYKLTRLLAFFPIYSFFHSITCFPPLSLQPPLPPLLAFCLPHSPLPHKSCLFFFSFPSPYLTHSPAN